MASMKAARHDLARRLLSVDADGNNWRIIDSNVLRPRKRSICVVGPARIGKSTLLNALAHVLAGEGVKLPQKMFKAAPGFDHVTTGVDYFMVPGNDVLLVDFQGIMLDNARFDHYLMLICYVMSTDIVLNVRGQIDNSIFSMFNSILFFLHNIRENKIDAQKPRLIIRIQDCPKSNKAMLNGDPQLFQKQLDKLLSLNNDQNDNMKVAIREAFHEIVVLASTAPDVGTDGEIAADDPTIENLAREIANLPSLPIPKVLESPEKLSAALRQIIEDSKIDYHDLDVYINAMKIKLLKHVEDLRKDSPELFDKRFIDTMNGSDESSLQYLERKARIAQIEEKSMTMFAEVPVALKSSAFSPAFAEMRQICTDAEVKNQGIAREKVAPLKAKYDEVVKQNATSTFRWIGGILNFFRQQNPVNELRAALQSLDKVVREEMLVNCRTYEEKLEIAEREIRALEAKTQADIQAALKALKLEALAVKLCQEYVDRSLAKGQYSSSLKLEPALSMTNPPLQNRILRNRDRSKPMSLELAQEVLKAAGTFENVWEILNVFIADAVEAHNRHFFLDQDAKVNSDDVLSVDAAAFRSSAVVKITQDDLQRSVAAHRHSMLAQMGVLPRDLDPTKVTDVQFCSFRFFGKRIHFVASHFQAFQRDVVTPFLNSGGSPQSESKDSELTAKYSSAFILDIPANWTRSDFLLINRANAFTDALVRWCSSNKYQLHIFDA